MTSTRRPRRASWLLPALLCITAGCAPAVVKPATDRKSISAYVSCSGTADDTTGATKAFAAARNSSFTLVVDCPVRLHSGIAVDRGIFIDNGTSVEFTGGGKFIGGRRRDCPCRRSVAAIMT